MRGDHVMNGGARNLHGLLQLRLAPKQRKQILHLDDDGREQAERRKGFDAEVHAKTAAGRGLPVILDHVAQKEQHADDLNRDQQHQPERYSGIGFESQRHRDHF